MVIHRLSRIPHRQIGAVTILALTAATTGWAAAPAADQSAQVTVAAPAGGKRANSAMRAKLDSIIIPTLAAEERPAREVFALLLKAARDQDPAKDGVNVFFKCPPDALNRRITVDFRKIPLGDALLYLCKACGLDYTVEEYAVSIFAKTQP